MGCLKLSNHNVVRFYCAKVYVKVDKYTTSSYNSSKYLTHRQFIPELKLWAFL